MTKVQRVSTGLTGLDEVIKYLRWGDNVVFRVQKLDQYIKLVTPFVEQSLLSGQKVVYLRFAQHPRIINEQLGVKVYSLEPAEGFEHFTTQVYQIIRTEGTGVCYVFDCLTDLREAWATDAMVSNFFLVTCPYLQQLNTIAYFALFSNSDSFQTVASIRETAQIFLEVYEGAGQTYIQPLKVWQRYTSTIFLPHLVREQKLHPITNSGLAARLMTGNWARETVTSKGKLDYWEEVFLDALELREKVKSGSAESNAEKKLIAKICKMMLSRDPQFLSLLTQYFSLDDLIEIKSRLIGSGFIGGKAVGMLLARKILAQDATRDWSNVLEPSDAFYLGSDLFYNYLIKNQLWMLRQEQRQPDKYLQVGQELQAKLLAGDFPDNFQEQFLRLLEYYGQAPIIIRSSSLLEDSFGNAFAGKYESIFCINQGSLTERYQKFTTAVRKIYASTMNVEALRYRLKRGMHQQDEQMALLIQRVSGSFRQHYFFPDVAGVGFSYNTYVWDQRMDPSAGMVRAVIGLGTRAVNRLEGDYARTMALDQPLLKPYTGLPEFQKFSQREVDLLDIQAGQVISLPLAEMLPNAELLKASGVVERDYETENTIAQLGLPRREAWTASFDQMAQKTTFPQVMQQMLKTLEKVYQYPIDIEFTLNFQAPDKYTVNLLQCRPLQVKGLTAQVEMPKDVTGKQVLFHSQGHFMGGNIQKQLQRIIYVDIASYVKLKTADRYEVARTVGRLNQLVDKEKISVLLLGPGRWGTSTPSLGVPVTFSEINNITVLGEISYLKAGYMPEVSYGTHFFQDLVESEIFYVGIFPERKEVSFRQNLLTDLENQLPELLPTSAGLQEVIKVYDFTGTDARKVEIFADTLAQEVICLLQ